MMLTPHFYELNIELEAQGEKSPIETFSNLGQTANKLVILSKQISTPLKLGLFSIKIASTDKIPDSPEWLDIEILPSITQPHKNYYIAIIYRMPSTEPLQQFTENLPATITNIIKTLEC